MADGCAWRPDGRTDGRTRLACRAVCASPDGQTDGRLNDYGRLSNSMNAIIFEGMPVEASYETGDLMQQMCLCNFLH